MHLTIQIFQGSSLCQVNEYSTHKDSKISNSNKYRFPASLKSISEFHCQERKEKSDRGEATASYQFSIFEDKALHPIEN